MSQAEQPVGSVAEEAAKLFEALQARADPGAADQRRGAGLGAALGAVLADLGSAGEHDEAGSECRSCPVCRAIALYRGVKPEVKHHLASAAESLLHAVAEAMETRVPEESRDGRAHPPVGTERSGS